MSTEKETQAEESREDASPKRATATPPNRAEKAAARAYWRLWRRNWRPPYRKGDAPASSRG